jgi:hypothetical protein
MLLGVSFRVEDILLCISELGLRFLAVNKFEYSMKSELYAVYMYLQLHV